MNCKCDGLCQYSRRGGTPLLEEISVNRLHINGDLFNNINVIHVYWMSFFSNLIT